MLKKIAILIITCLFAMTALSGCSIIAKQNEKSLIEDALQKRYGEEFVCMRTWNNDADGYYSHSFYGLCHPKDDDGLLFEVLSGSDGTLLIDEYASTLASRIFRDEFDERIGDSLGTHYTYCRNYYDPNGDAVAKRIKNGNFTLEYFMNDYINTFKSNKLSLYYSICMDITKTADISYENEYDVIIDTIKHIHRMGQQLGMDLQISIKFYFVPTEIYQNCVNYFQENANINSLFYDLIEKNAPYGEPKCMIKFLLKDNKELITQEEYIEIRKEIDNNA